MEVTASNLLGNTSTQYPFFVQIPPSSCALSSGRFNVGLGSFITINATDLSGSRVKFDWTMGDTTEYKDAGILQQIIGVESHVYFRRFIFEPEFPIVFSL